MSDDLGPEGYDRNIHDRVHSLEVANRLLVSQRARVEQALEAARKRYQAFEGLRDVAAHYVATREGARASVARSEAARQAHGAQSGTGFATPMETIDAVREWKKSAIQIADALAKVFGL